MQLQQKIKTLQPVLRSQANQNNSLLITDQSLLRIPEATKLGFYQLHTYIFLQACWDDL